MSSMWTLVFVSSDPAQDCILKQYSCLRRNMRMSGEPLVKFRPDNIAPWLSLDYYTVIWSNCGCSWLADGLTIKAGRLAKKPKNTVTSGGSSGVIKISSSFCSFPKSCKHKRAEEQSKKYVYRPIWEECHQQLQIVSFNLYDRWRLRSKLYHN